MVMGPQNRVEGRLERALWATSAYSGTHHRTLEHHQPSPDIDNYPSRESVGVDSVAGHTTTSYNVARRCLLAFDSVA